MSKNKWIIIWLIILSAIILLILIYLIYVPNINVYIPDNANYTFDVGNNLLNLINQSGVFYDYL